MSLSIGLNEQTGNYGEPVGFSCCGVRPICGFNYIDEKQLQIDFERLISRFPYRAFIGITANHQKVAEAWLKKIRARPLSRIANATNQAGGPIFNLTVWEIPGRQGRLHDLPNEDKEEFSLAMIQQNEIERVFT